LAVSYFIILLTRRNYALCRPCHQSGNDGRNDQPALTDCTTEKTEVCTYPKNATHHVRIVPPYWRRPPGRPDQLEIPIHPWRPANSHHLSGWCYWLGWRAHVV